MEAQKAIARVSDERSKREEYKRIGSQSQQLEEVEENYITIDLPYLQKCF